MLVDHVLEILGRRTEDFRLHREQNAEIGLVVADIDRPEGVCVLPQVGR